MPGTKTVYTWANADSVFKYADDPWAWAAGFWPSGTIQAVLIWLHGGGWIAQSNIWNHKFDPDNALLDKNEIDAYLNAGVAVVWAEYPQGWQTSAQARVANSSRFPQIPRTLGRVVQYLKTHAADGEVTRSTSIVLPTSDSQYGMQGVSAGAIMALWLAMQRDGFLSYNPAGRGMSRGPFEYTYSHRLGWVAPLDCATDLRRYGASSSALPYFSWVGSLYTDSAGNATIGDTDRFSTVPIDVKGAASPLVAASQTYSPNLNVGVWISNGSGNSESSFLTSGMTIVYGAGTLTGTPQVGETVTAGGGSTGTLVNHDTTNRLLHINTVSGTVSTWTGSLSFGTSGASVTAPGNTAQYGDDTYPTFLTESQVLTLWDADNLPILGASEHDIVYMPAFKRLREAQGVTIDRYFVGYPYVYNSLTNGGYDGPNGSYGGNDSYVGRLDWLTNDLGILV